MSRTNPARRPWAGQGRGALTSCRSVATAVDDATTQQIAAGSCSSVEQLVDHLTVPERQVRQCQTQRFERRQRFVDGDKLFETGTATVS